MRESEVATGLCGHYCHINRQEVPRAFIIAARIRQRVKTMVSTRGGASSSSPPATAAKKASPARARRKSSDSSPKPAAKPRGRRKSSADEAPAPAAKPRARRKSSAEASPKPTKRGEPPRGDVLDEWEPLYFDAGQQEQNEPEAAEEQPLFVVDSAPAAANVVRVAYDGGEAELPAPAYFGALRAATAAARLDALERTARRAERALRDASDDDEAVRPAVAERTDDATDAALARAFAAAQTGQGPKRKKRKTRAEKRAPAKDAGPGWYGLPRADATVSADDRAALALRGVADPKRHYKRQDAPSEFAALGTVVAGKFDGASGTLKKRERKTGLMGELLADAGARSYAKRRFTAVQERQRGPGLSTLKQKRKALARRKKGR